MVAGRQKSSILVPRNHFCRALLLPLGLFGNVRRIVDPLVAHQQVLVRKLGAAAFVGALESFDPLVRRLYVDVEDLFL
jgi:hypothetical protein